MTTALRFREVSSGHRALGLTFALALVMVLLVPQAHAAEYPNILVGENMTVGSTGPGVTVLQGILSEDGYLSIPTGISMGYYGALTQAAVARYQAAQNVAPTAGYFGPLTKVAMHQELMKSGWLTMFGW